MNAAPQQVPLGKEIAMISLDLRNGLVAASFTLAIRGSTPIRTSGSNTPTALPLERWPRSSPGERERVRAGNHQAGRIAA
jgi:hypothetical protein